MNVSILDSVGDYCLQRASDRGLGRELAAVEETVRSSPTSSRWAVETSATRSRSGDDRRLSGERCDGCCTIGEEIVQQPPQPVLFTPGPVRRVPKLEEEFSTSSGEER